MKKCDFAICRIFGQHNAVGQFQRGFDRIGQTVVEIGLDHQTVNHDRNVVLFFLV